MEDEGNHGNDDTRSFILSRLAALQWSRVYCVLCRERLKVFDRYPLIDGTFFLSPRQHTRDCAEVCNFPILINRNKNNPIVWILMITFFVFLSILFSRLGKNWGSYAVSVSCVYGLSGRQWSRTNTLSFVHYNMGWFQSCTWYNVQLRYLCCHAMLCWSSKRE